MRARDLDSCVPMVARYLLEVPHLELAEAVSRVQEYPELRQCLVDALERILGEVPATANIGGLGQLADKVVAELIKNATH